MVNPMVTCVPGIIRQGKVLKGNRWGKDFQPRWARLTSTLLTYYASEDDVMKGVVRGTVDLQDSTHALLADGFDLPGFTIVTIK